MKSLLFCMMVLIAANATAQTPSPYLKKLFISGNDTLPYRIMYPLKYNPQKKYPLVLFLHGAGERGTNNESQLIHGGALFADSLNRVKFPAIVIFPQCPYTDFWARIRQAKLRTDSTPQVLEYLVHGLPNKSLQLVMQLMDKMVEAAPVDTSRIYVGGLSMGGMGTFEILWRKPNFFAAAFPICGGGNTSKAELYGNNLPVWVFHGAKDDVVDVNDSRKMVAALRNAKAKIRYSEYPEVMHASWVNAFAEPDLLPWLFSQRKKKSKARTGKKI